MSRGEIWWVKFPRPLGRRPAVLVSRDQAYRVRTQVTVVPLTTRIRQLPVEVVLGPEEGIPRESVANADLITTVPKRLVVRYITTLSPSKERALDVAIKFALNLS